jgi:putative spermidine/putrescine transport system ATP-binding protein
MTVRQNIGFGLKMRGMARAEIDRRVDEGLALVRLESQGHKLPGQLSGGQQQRVAIARALANQPAVILADEPTGNLDTKTGTEIVALLRELNQEEGVTVICSTHDPKMLESSARICWIEDGLLVKVTPGGAAARANEQRH